MPETFAFALVSTLVSTLALALTLVSTLVSTLALALALAPLPSPLPLGGGQRYSRGVWSSTRFNDVAFICEVPGARVKKLLVLYYGQPKFNTSQLFRIVPLDQIGHVEINPRGDDELEQRLVLTGGADNADGDQHELSVELPSSLDGDDVDGLLAQADEAYMVRSTVWKAEHLELQTLTAYERARREAVATADREEAPAAAVGGGGFRLEPTTDLVRARMQNEAALWNVADVADTDTQCAICICEFEPGEQYVRWPAEGCTHFYHLDCSLEHARRSHTCPQCRAAAPAAVVAPPAGMMDLNNVLAQLRRAFVVEAAHDDAGFA
jgi:hypothetical protein